MRDLARYGQLLANKGRANSGKQVIPADWVEQTLLNYKQGTRYQYGSGYHYYNHVVTNGRVLSHMGWVGQLLYADTENKVVIAKLGALTMPSGADIDSAVAFMNLGDAISARLNKL